MKYSIKENEEVKFLRSDVINYNFDKKTGLMMTWGKTKEDDPSFSPFGPFILDLELSVNGCPNNCSFCYKGNTNDAPTNMTFETFKKIVDKMPRVLTQIAFGITGVQTNPDFLKILKYCREVKQIIPNFTLSGIDLTDEIAEKIAEYVGAVAVSAYETNKNVCYDTVEKFSKLCIEQTNIHLLTSKESKTFVYEVLNDIKNDARLSKLNAVVFLKVKTKGRARGRYNNLSISEYIELIDYCLKNKIRFGFDSCTAPDFEIAIRSNTKLTEDEKKKYIAMSESCESFGVQSAYIDVNGVYFPCSFATGEGEWKEGLDVLNCEDFVKDIWFNEKLNKYRRMSLQSCKNGCRKCLIFEEINPEEEIYKKMIDNFDLASTLQELCERETIRFPRVEFK
jgi:MoaA/NifB/PqqE/SkfB family radical SAM enzyme